LVGRSGGVAALAFGHGLHGQADAALLVHFQHLDLDHVAFLEHVADALHALVRDLRDVHQAVLAGGDGHERAEVHQLGDLALLVPSIAVAAFPAPVRFSGLSFSYNVAYAICGGATPVAVTLLLRDHPLAPAYYLAAMAVVGVGLGLWVERRARAGGAGQQA